MNYKRIYDELCVPSESWSNTKGFEKHRIVPGCLGGKYEDGNVAVLTFRAHRLAHRLLSKIYPDHLGLRTSYLRMYGHSEQSRIECARAGAKAMQAKYGSPFKNMSHEERSNRSSKTMTKTMARIMADPIASEAHRSRCSAWSRAQATEHKSHAGSIGAKKANAIVRECPHCQKLVKGQMFFRWHDNNCKYNNNYEVSI